MNFTGMSLQDMDGIRPYFDRIRFRTCDFSIGGMFMWRDYYHMEYAIENDTFFSRLYHQEHEVYYNIPVSENMGEAVKTLLSCTGGSVKFCTVPEECLPLFSDLGAKTVIREQTDLADYLYRAEDLRLLRGKKYNGQRNLINQFKRSVTEWHFDRIEPSAMEKIREFFCTTYLPSASDSEFEQEENRKVLEVLEHFDNYHLLGGYLTADGAIVGFTINEIIGDTLFTHIEKADRRRKGAYQMLVNQGAMTFASDSVCYINREEDMGDAGLRESKRSYHPVKMMKKYLVEIG